MSDAPQTQTLTDAIDPARARALQVVLGRKATIGPGDALPPFFHHIYFWDAQPAARLGRDGHPRVGTGLVPDLGLPRRMWAGGRLEFHAPLRAGIPAERRSVVEKAQRKTGRSGPLGFVTLHHEIRQDGAHCLSEWQDLVYREDPDAAVPEPDPPTARHDEDILETADFDSTMLFRYSALTFNGHRIHYDRDYARRVEGYAGLVVHGPLLAQLLMLLAERELGGLTSFGFRATAPLREFETAELCWKEGTAWVRGPDGRQCLIARAEG